MTLQRGNVPRADLEGGKPMASTMAASQDSLGGKVE